MIETSSASIDTGADRALGRADLPAATPGRLDGALALVFFLAAFGFGAWRLRYGIDLRDEAFYLAAPLRYALGDLPFRDEIFNPARMFDVLLAPLFVWIPQLGVLELRAGWLCAQLGATFALFALLRRFAPSSLVAAACTSVVFLPNLFWTPGYHLIGTYAFLLAWSLWLIACLRPTRAAAARMGLVAGLAYGIAAIAYLPALATGIVPGSVFVFDLLRRDAPPARRWATGIFLATLGMVAVAAVGCVWASGLLEDWIDAQGVLSTTGPYAYSAIQKLTLFASQLRDPEAFVLAGIAIAALLALLQYAASRLPVQAGWLRLGVIGASAGTAFALGYGVLHGGTLRITRPFVAIVATPFEITALIAGMLCASLGLELWRRRSARNGDAEPVEPASWRFVALALGSGSLIFAFLQGYLSGQAFKVMFAVVPLMAVAAVALHRSLRGLDPSALGAGRAHVAVIALCAAIAAEGYAYCAESRFRSAPIALQTAVFKHPRLAGVHEAPEKVERLEAIAAAIASLVRPGELLLAYPDGALLYFMTDTRPAIDHAWTYAYLPRPLLRRSLERMLERERVPAHAVEDIGRRDLGWGRSNPIRRFVNRHYEPLEQVAGYQIWRLREGS